MGPAHALTLAILLFSPQAWSADPPGPRNYRECVSEALFKARGVAPEQRTPAPQKPTVIRLQPILAAFAKQKATEHITALKSHRDQPLNRAEHAAWWVRQRIQKSLQPKQSYLPYFFHQDGTSKAIGAIVDRARNTEIRPEKFDRSLDEVGKWLTRYNKQATDLSKIIGDGYRDLVNWIQVKHAIAEARRLGLREIAFEIVGEDGQIQMRAYSSHRLTNFELDVAQKVRLQLGPATAEYEGNTTLPKIHTNPALWRKAAALMKSEIGAAADYQRLVIALDRLRPLALELNERDPTLFSDKAKKVQDLVTQIEAAIRTRLPSQRGLAALEYEIYDKELHAWEKGLHSNLSEQERIIAGFTNPTGNTQLIIEEASKIFPWIRPFLSPRRLPWAVLFSFLGLYVAPKAATKIMESIGQEEACAIKETEKAYLDCVRLALGLEVEEGPDGLPVSEALTESDRARLAKFKDARTRHLAIQAEEERIRKDVKTQLDPPNNSLLPQIAQARDEREFSLLLFAHLELRHPQPVTRLRTLRILASGQPEGSAERIKIDEELKAIRAALQPDIDEGMRAWEPARLQMESQAQDQRDLNKLLGELAPAPR